MDKNGMKQVIALGLVLGVINGAAILGDRLWGNSEHEHVVSAKAERKAILDNQARIESYLVRLAEANVQLSKAVDRLVIVVERK